MARGDLTDEEWAVLEGLLPSELGRRARPAHHSGHVSAAGAKGGLVRRLLVDHAAALRAKSTPAVTIRDALLALS